MRAPSFSVIPSGTRGTTLTGPRFTLVATAAVLALAGHATLVRAQQPAGAAAHAQPDAVRPAVARPGLGVPRTVAAKPTIVLVHGAFADAMAWARVIPLLERDGYAVTAVENPLTSFDADVANTKRVIDAQPGPVVVVGHSYGGAVITQAAAGSDKVRALVYVAALAPDSGEAVGALMGNYPSALSKALVPDAGGFVSIDRAKLRDVFAADVPEAETRVMAATQKPIHGAAFQAKPTAAAWRGTPSWFVVARADRSINPDLERFYAKRMHATTVEVTSSHVPFLSHPAAVARVLEQAAQVATGQGTAAAAGSAPGSASATR